MRYLFGAQDVSDLVHNGYEDLATDVQRAGFKENKKKDCKALFYIQQPGAYGEGIYGVQAP